MRAENHTPARMPLDAAALRRAAVRPGGLWREVEVVASTGSTNADLLARALRGEPEGAVLAAEEQRAGRGRMGRTWISPPRAALTFSLLVRPGGAARPARLAAAAHRGGRRRGGHQRDRRRDQAEMAERRAGRPTPSSAGILAEAAGDAVVVGIGLNVSTEPAEQPPARPRPRRAARHVAARQPGATAPDREDAAARHPGRLRALVPGLAAGRRRPGPQRAARRVHPAVRHDRPPGPGRTPRRSGALRPGRRRRPGRQAAGPRLLRAPSRRWPPATSSTCADAVPRRRRLRGANASAAARQAAGTAGTR